MEPLAGIAPVLLGLLSWGPRSGYELKQLIDRSTRFFWAASYGSIYPQLRRLEEQGLIRGAQRPTGARQRTVYELTADGRAALEEWLRSAGAACELRDTGLLRLFFADVLSPGEALAAVREYRAEHERTLAELRGVQAGPDAPREGFTALVLEYGIGLHEWIVDWSRRTEERLAAEAPAVREGAA